MSPSKRKSPYKHPVKKHVRKGTPVNNYERGKGDKAIKNRRSRVVGGNPSSSAYDVTVQYIGSTEVVIVDAKNYLNALDMGLENRDKIERPTSIRMRMVK